MPNKGTSANNKNDLNGQVFSLCSMFVHCYTSYEENGLIGIDLNKHQQQKLLAKYNV